MTANGSRAFSTALAMAAGEGMAAPSPAAFCPSGVNADGEGAAYSPAEGLPVETFRTYMVVAAVGTVLAAGYLLWLLQRTAMGSPREEFANSDDIVDVTRTEWIAWAPLLVGILLFGLVPGLIFDVTDPAVVGLLATGG